MYDSHSGSLGLSVVLLFIFNSSQSIFVLLSSFFSIFMTTVKLHITKQQKIDIDFIGVGNLVNHFYPFNSREIFVQVIRERGFYRLF